MRKISSRMITKRAGAGIAAIEGASKILSESGEALSRAEEALNLAKSSGGEVSSYITKAYREAMGNQVAAKKGLNEAKNLILTEIKEAKTAGELNDVKAALEDKIPKGDLEEINKLITSKLEEINKIEGPTVVPDAVAQEEKALEETGLVRSPSGGSRTQEVQNLREVPPRETGLISTRPPTTVSGEVTGGAADNLAREDNLPAIVKEKTTSIASRVGKWYGGITGPQKLILVGAILGEAIYQLTPEQAAERIDSELSSYEQILAPIYKNDVVDWVIGGDLDVISEADKQIILRKVTKAVLTNDIQTLSPEGIAGLIANSSSAKTEVGQFAMPGEGWTDIANQFEERPFVNMQTLKADSGAWSAIQNASDVLTEKAANIASSAAAIAAAEAAKPATPAATSAPVAPTPAPTEPPPISARPAEAGGTTTPISSGIPEMSSILVDLGYLKTPQTSWTTELDTAFRAFMDKGTSLTKDMYHTNLASGKESWPEVASLVGFQPNIAGAAKAVKTLSDSLGPSVASSGTTSSDTAAAGGTDMLPKIISAMYTGNLTKILGPDFTRGIDFVNEARRMQILVGALGGASAEGYNNAAKVILRQDPALSTDLPKTLTGAIDKAYVKQNMDLFRRIQAALNKIISGAFGPLAPARMDKAISGMRAWLQKPEGGGWTISTASSSKNSQWVKLANERKIKLRTAIAAEMTPAEIAAARRIKMREAV